MVGRYDLVEIKRIEDLAMFVFTSSRHALLPIIVDSIENGITVRQPAQLGFLQQNIEQSGRAVDIGTPSSLTPSPHAGHACRKPDLTKDCWPVLLE
jgi:hypothetical protein